MKLLLECRTFKNEKMKMLSNLVSEIGDVIDSLTLSSKEKMQLRANLTEVLSRFEADLQREQSSGDPFRITGELAATFVASDRDARVFLCRVTGDIHPTSFA